MPGQLIDADEVFRSLLPGARYGLAVSGGADSLALLILARDYAERHGLHDRFVVYSVDHGTRPEAAGEVALVVSTAQRFGFAARPLRWTGEKPQTGLQAAAREARYRLFAAAMVEDDAIAVLTAHHRRDQAETVLMRLAHGSGIDGLAGMEETSFVAGCRIHRPLLDVDPEALGEIVRQSGLTAVADPSNDDTAYERVRWRQLLPGLEAMGLTPERLAVFARRQSDAADLVADLATEAHRALVTHEGDVAVLPCGRFALLNPLVGVALLETILGYTSGDRRPVPLGALELLRDRLAAGPMKPATLHGCILRGNSLVLTIRKEGPRRPVRKHRELT